MTVTSTYLSAEKKTLSPAKVMLYDAAEMPWKFCHHPALYAFDGALYAMWSNGEKGEDDLGQRVLYAKSADGAHWSSPKLLCDAFMGKNMLVCLTAAGFYAHHGTLNAYVAAYEYENRAPFSDDRGNTRAGSECIDTMLYVLTSTDGEHWSAPTALNLPLCPNYGPVALKSGRLLMTGNWAHAYTDDPSGLSGWTLRGFCADEMLLPKPVRDDPSYFWKVSKAMGLSGALCEGAFLEEADGIHMLYRSYGPTLFETVSPDGGEHWSLPTQTDFPNGNSKFFLGRLPDGRAVYIGNPGPDKSRCPLVLSLSKDGMTFDRHFLLITERVPRKFDGLYKGGIYGYPHAVVFQDKLYVICSIWKEDIIVLSLPLSSLSA